MLMGPNTNWKEPLVLNTSGDYSNILFSFGQSTDVYMSCPIEYQNKFYILGGTNQKRQVD